jgi:hypothetical protein
MMMANQDQPQKPQQPLSLSSIRLGSRQPAVLAEFYEKFFGRPADYENGPFICGWVPVASSA